MPKPQLKESVMISKKIEKEKEKEPMASLITQNIL